MGSVSNSHDTNNEHERFTTNDECRKNDEARNPNGYRFRLSEGKARSLLFSGARIAICDGVQDLGDVGHVSYCNAPMSCSPSITWNCRTSHQLKRIMGIERKDRFRWRDISVRCDGVRSAAKLDSRTAAHNSGRFCLRNSSIRGRPLYRTYYGTPCLARAIGTSCPGPATLTYTVAQ